MRRKAAEAAEAAAATLEPPAASSSGDAGSVSVRSRSSQTWAMLIKRLYELCEALDYVELPLSSPRVSHDFEAFPPLETCSAQHNLGP